MKETLSDKRRECEWSFTKIDFYFYKEENVKECFKRIELKMLKRFKSASIPMLKIIKEELGKELVK